ncbi:hypothetical protein GCM10023340_19640 [Nocardioides marinquilinus]|uniref:Bacterial Ig domain-containing protein n=1 Tax=Nocardioides marinquilinus TaxID=1210400 RepID=A0ABP9PIW4_9ACTN
MTARRPYALLAATAATAVAATALTVSGAALDASHAAEQASASRIAVATSDATVRSGEQFVLSGRLSQAGVVRVGSLGSDGWQPVSGAVVHTRRDGTYSVRVILSRTGERVLRVTGDPDAAGVANSRARVTVTVR